MASQTYELITKFTADLGSFRSDMKQAQSSLGDAKNGIAKMGAEAGKQGNFISRAVGGIKSKLGLIAPAVAGAFAVKKLADFGVKAMEVTATLNAMDSQFEQIFKGAEGVEMMSRLEAISGDLNIQMDRLTGSANRFGGQFKGAGIKSTRAIEMTETATRLAADSAAFYDTSIETASASLSSFLKGNFAAGDALGVFTSANQMSTMATEKFGKKWQDLTEAQKQDLLLQKVEEVYRLNGAIGQAARESGEWENVVGNLKATWNRFLTLVGTPLLKVVLPALQKVTGAMGWLQEKINSFSLKEFIAGFGFFEPMIQSFERLKEAVTRSFSGIGDPVRNALSEIGRIAGGILEPIARLISTSLRAIADVSTWAWGKFSGAAGEAFTAFKSVYETILKPAIDWIVEGFDLLLGGVEFFITGFMGLTEPDNFEGIYSLWDIMTEVGIGVRTAVDAILGHMGDLAGRIRTSIGGVVDWLRANWPAFKEILQGSWESIIKFYDAYLAPVVDNIVKGFYNIIDAVSSFSWDEFLNSKPILAIRDAIGWVGEKLGALVTAVKTFDWAAFANSEPVNRVKDAIQFVKEKIEAVVSAVSTFDWGKVAESEWFQVLKDALGLVKDAFLWLVDNVPTALGHVKDFFTAIFESKLAQDILTGIKDVAETLADKLINIKTTAKEFSDWISDHSDLLVGLATFFGSIAAAIGLYNIGIAIATTATGIWTAVSAAASTATYFLVGAFALLTSPIALIVMGIAALITIGVLLWKNWDTIKAKASELWQAIKDKFTEIKDAVITKFTEIKDGISEKLTAIKDKISEIWGGIKTAIGEKITAIKDAIAEKFEEIRTSISGKFDEIKNSVTEKWNEIKDAIVEKAGEIWTAITEKFNEIKEFFSGIWTGIKDGAVEAWNNIKETLAPYIDAVVQVIMVPISLLRATFEGIWLAIRTVFEMAWHAIQVGAEAAWNFIKEKIVQPVQEMWTAVTEKIGELVTWLSGKWDAIKTAAQEKWAAIRDKALELWTKVKENIIKPITDAWNAVVQKARDIYNAIASKFTEVKNKATEIWNGIKNAISEKVEAAKKAVTDKVEAIKKSVTDKFNALKDKISEIWATIKTSISNKADEIKTSVTEKFQAIRQAIEEKVQAAKDKVTEIWDNIKTSVTEKAQGIWDAVTEKFDAIKKAIINPIQAAKDKVSEIVQGIKGFFTNLKLNIPKPVMPKLPTFGLKTKDISFLGKNFTIPAGLSIKWNAEGGIFDRPTIFNTAQGLQGVGEAGPEAIMPIKKLPALLKPYFMTRDESHAQTAELQHVGQPVELSLRLGALPFKAFVDDITRIQDGEIDLELKYT